MRFFKIFIIIVTTIVLFMLCWWVTLKYIPSSEQMVLSEMQLKSDINAIARKYTNVYAICQLFDTSDKLRFSSENRRTIVGNMLPNERVISISGGSGLTQNYLPIQIYGIFESWLFIENKKLPYNVVAICWDYTSGGIDNSNDQTSFITKTEFEGIYNSINLKDLSNEQAAKILADKWIEQTEYVKK